MKRNYINVKATAEMKDRFQKVCREKDLTESLVIRKLIERWLNGEIKLEIE